MQIGKKNILIITLLCIVWSAFSCGKAGFYQKNVSFDNAHWEALDPASFEIDIADTTDRYNIYFMLRHDEQYAFNNIWIRYKYKMEGDSIFKNSERIDLLMADTDGKWLGRNFGGMWEHKMLLINNDNPIFKKAGKYEIQVEHLMRQETLEGVMQAGLQIEKL
jgi:gliding motility-associated lipoprotein GldH